MATERIFRKAEPLSAQLLMASQAVPFEPNWPGFAPTAAALFAAHADLDNSVTSIAGLEAQLDIARGLRDTRIATGRTFMQSVDDATDLLYTKAGPQKNNFGLTPIVPGPPPPPPGPIVIARILDGTLPSSIFIDWEAQEGAAAYEIEWFTSSALTLATRVGVTTTTQSEYMTPTLTQGTQYWFHVRAVRANQKGPWSDPATRVAGV